MKMVNVRDLIDPAVEAAKLAAASYKYKVGDTPFYTNDYGVKWGRAKITKLGPIKTYHGHHVYIYYYIDLGPEVLGQAPWSPVEERNLTIDEPSDENLAERRSQL